MVKNKEDSKPGIGLDVGTAFIVAARMEESKISYNILRDAFLKLPKDEDTITILKQLKVSFTSDDLSLYILGENAIEIANGFNRIVQRPMANGVISPIETDAVEMIKVLLATALGSPKHLGETCVYTIPAEPLNLKRNTPFNLEYHEDKLDHVLRSLGFKPKAINEATCIGYDCLRKEKLTGVSISFGSGMANVSYMVLGTPVETFSLIGSGDYIDSFVANQFNLSPTKITKFKEKTQFHLIKDANSKDKKVEALCMAYNRVITNLVSNLEIQFADINVDDSISFAIAGGTSLAIGFKELFEQKIKEAHLPFEIGMIHQPEEPLTSVVRGALYKAQLEEASDSKKES